MLVFLVLPLNTGIAGMAGDGGTDTSERAWAFVRACVCVCVCRGEQ